MQHDAEGATGGDGNDGVGVAGSSNSCGDAHVNDPVYVEAGSSEEEAYDQVDVTTKRRRVCQLFYSQRRLQLESQANGSRRVGLLDRYKSGAAKRVRPASLSSEQSHGRTCMCLDTLRSHAERFKLAQRTAQERRYAAKSSQNKCRQDTHNYARLAAAVIDTLFDGRGNLLVHERCARAFLNVSNSWMAARHSQALSLAQTPIKKMTKSEIATSYNCDVLVGRIRRPDDCMLSVTAFFKSSSSSAVFEVADLTPSHGLTGQQSNRTKHKEREMFQTFVSLHRAPTGRSPDKHGRYHGAAYYLDSRWEVERKSSAADERASFSEEFNKALMVNNLPPVHVDIPGRWLREMFGPRTRVEGCVGPSDEHTVLFPHKTDACATCECLRADIRREHQSLRRHEQQPDKGSLMRRESIDVVKSTLADMTAALEDHKAEAARALAYHRNCLSGAAARYADLSTLLVRSWQSLPRPVHRP